MTARYQAALRTDFPLRARSQLGVIVQGLLQMLAIRKRPNYFFSHFSIYMTSSRLLLAPCGWYLHLCREKSFDSLDTYLRLLWMYGLH
jgi:hypothetical protein